MKKRTLAIVFACATLGGGAQVSQDHVSQDHVRMLIEHEVPENCIGEDFSALLHAEPPVTQLEAWVHYEFCQQVAVTLARKYLQEHARAL